MCALVVGWGGSIGALQTTDEDLFAERGERGRERDCVWDQSKIDRSTNFSI